MATAAERQRKFREAQKAKGLVPFTGFVHESQVADMGQLVKALQMDPDLLPTLLRHARTGKVGSVGKLNGQTPSSTIYLMQLAGGKPLKPQGV